VSRVPAGQRAGVELPEGLVHDGRVPGAAEDFLATAFHHMAGEHAAHHRQLCAARRIEEQIDLRLVAL
jgi:hypothetical protein